jgi:glycerol-1-phosphate dehydrogenase [NAD(P)+]
MTNKSAVEQALEAASETRALRIGRGFLSQVAKLFKEQFPGGRAIIVADQNTYRVAGKQVVAELKAGGIAQEPPVVFNDPDLYAEYSYVDRLTANFGSHRAIPVAVGSGTINDLVKLASHLTERPYMCVATAASMDGYTAFGASITAQGSKQTFNCPAPQAVLADVDILSDAPPELTAAGYADLSAKITAGADWILADQLGEEAIDTKAWSIVQDGLPSALSDPKGVAEGNPEAIAKLVEGLMLGGFAMQYSRTSRCASGAEHQFSHLWNMEHFLHNGKLVSHGFQVSLGMLAVTALYEQALNHPWEKLDVEACCHAWPSPEESDAKAIEMFADTDIPLLGLQETRAKYITRDRLAEQLYHLKANWPEIRNLLERQIVPYHELKRKLKMAGTPVDPEEIGMSRKRLRDSYIRAWSIRRRFTILDLAVRAACLDPWLDGIFKKGGVWENA